MNNDTKVFSLFPTPVMIVKGLLESTVLEPFATELEKEVSTQNVNSNLLKHSAVVDPASNDLFQLLQPQIMSKLIEYGVLLFGEELAWFVKEMWVNVLRHGGHQATHSHANSFVSGVFYLTDSHSSSSLLIHKNGGGGNDFVFTNHHEQSQTGPFNTTNWQSPNLEAGDMILFPSYMLHTVPPNKGGTRISLAFNAAPEQLNSWGYKISFSK